MGGPYLPRVASASDGETDNDQQQPDDAAISYTAPHYVEDMAWH